MQLIEVVPFKNCKERFKLVEKYRLTPNCVAEVFMDYLYVEVFDWDIRRKHKRRRGRGKKENRR